jgi:hypothetical protein
MADLMGQLLSLLALCGRLSDSPIHIVCEKSVVLEVENLTKREGGDIQDSKI